MSSKFGYSHETYLESCVDVICQSATFTVYLATSCHDLKLLSARLAQSAERKALNLVVVGSSPTVGVAEVQAATTWTQELLHLIQLFPHREKKKPASFRPNSSARHSYLCFSRRAA